MCDLRFSFVPENLLQRSGQRRLRRLSSSPFAERSTLVGTMASVLVRAQRRHAVRLQIEGGERNELQTGEGIDRLSR